MIRLPGSVADAVFAGSGAVLPEIVDVDVDLAARNVTRLGGRPAVFAAALSAGLAAGLSAGPDATDPERARDLIGIAGWRAGVLGLRVDALERVGRLSASSDGTRAAAATLGIRADSVSTFLARQRTDRYWWPDRDAQNGYVCAVGGFIGVGGAWIRPADDWTALDEPGAFALRVADAWWRLDADVWGAHLSRLPDAPARRRPDGGVQLVLRPDTHLAWLYVGPE